MFSPATGYAAIALGYLADCEMRSSTVEDIAREGNIPTAYLAKIMHALARKGFVQTRRGVGGGVKLTCDPSTTTLLNVCEALDDPIIEQRCMLGVAECSDERACLAHEFWTNFRKQLIAFACSTTIQSVRDFERSRWITPTQSTQSEAVGSSSSHQSSPIPRTTSSSKRKAK